MNDGGALNLVDSSVTRCTKSLLPEASASPPGSSPNERNCAPTLFLGGERDFNVPIEGSQQMYQALKSLGVDTQLIIYPNENHGIQRPSYQRDRMQRYLDWYDKYIKKAAGPSSTSTAR